MADRRMCQSAVVESDLFLDLPVGAQALYFHLGMHADDDGFVNGPRQIARKLRRPAKELQLLIDSGFLLNFDGIVVITHWRVANTLKLDRLKMLNYPHIAQKLYLAPTKAYSLPPQGESESLLEIRNQFLAPYRNRKVSKGKVKEDKVREDKIREDKIKENKVVEVAEENPDQPDAAPTAKSAFHFLTGKLGKGVVLLSEEQMEDLLDKLGLDGFDYYVEKLADFILRNQANVSNHYATILKWWQQDKGVV